MKDIYELDKQIQSLKEQKATLEDSINELQRKKTEILMGNDEFSSFVGNCIVWNHYGNKIYIRVCSVELIARGAKLSGVVFEANRGTGGGIGSSSVFSDRTLFVSDTDLSNIKKLTYEEFTKAWKELVDKFNDIINKN